MHDGSPSSFVSRTEIWNSSPLMFSDSRPFSQTNSPVYSSYSYVVSSAGQPSQGPFPLATAVPVIAELPTITALEIAVFCRTLRRDSGLVSGVSSMLTPPFCIPLRR